MCNASSIPLIVTPWGYNNTPACAGGKCFCCLDVCGTSLHFTILVLAHGTSPCRFGLRKVRLKLNAFDMVIMSHASGANQLHEQNLIIALEGGGAQEGGGCGRGMQKL